ncbi:Clp protease N-terminal domain-containing protein, partial [Streptococcus pyogenes]
MDQAEQLAKKSGDKFITLERLLQALLQVPGNEAGRILQSGGVTPEALNQAVNAMRKGRTADSASAEDQFEALKKYTR